MRLDPHGESLAAAHVLQPEAMWAAQLERSRDAVAQVQKSLLLGCCTCHDLLTLCFIPEDGVAMRKELVLPLGSTFGCPRASSQIKRFHQTLLTKRVMKDSKSWGGAAERRGGGAGGAAAHHLRGRQRAARVHGQRLCLLQARSPAVTGSA